MLPEVNTYLLKSTKTSYGLKFVVALHLLEADGLYGLGIVSCVTIYTFCPRFSLQDISSYQICGSSGQVNRRTQVRVRDLNGRQSLSYRYVGLPATWAA